MPIEAAIEREFGEDPWLYISELPESGDHSPELDKELHTDLPERVRKSFRKIPTPKLNSGILNYIVHRKKLGLSIPGKITRSSGRHDMLQFASQIMTSDDEENKQMLSMALMRCMT